MIDHRVTINGIDPPPGQSVEIVLWLPNQMKFMCHMHKKHMEYSVQCLLSTKCDNNKKR